MHITKIGLAAIEDGRLLVVRKRGKSTFILPGGKPENGEQELATLCREVTEELSCSIAGAKLEGRFNDFAADQPDATILVVLYSGTLVGTPIPQAEIEEMAWLDICEQSRLKLAPSIENHILPYLRTLRAESITQS